MLLSPDWIPAETRNEGAEREDDQATADDEEEEVMLLSMKHVFHVRINTKMHFSFLTKAQVHFTAKR